MGHVAVCLVAAAGVVAHAQPLELQQGDHICIIGNAFGERLQHDGWFETLIHSRFPKHELVFRNLSMSGDEIGGWQDSNQRLRSMSFGSHDEWLAGNSPVPQPEKLSPRDAGKVRENRFETTNTRADVIFAFYGSNESYGGLAALPAFREAADAFVKHTLSQQYNGKSAPRLVLFSPWPQEVLADPNLPSQAVVAEHNANTAAYAEALREVAKANRVFFVDLFKLASAHGLDGAPKAEGPLTTNGLFLNEQGQRHVALVAYQALFGVTAPQDLVRFEPLRSAVNAKNAVWYQRYRATDGYSTYGDRAFLKFAEGEGGYGEGLSNYSVSQRELEVIDVMTSNRDRAVWSVAQGKALKPQDDNLPEFIPVVSNKPGPLPGGKHEFLDGEAAISQMTVAQHMRVELFADEKRFPELVNPVQMAFDAQGRLWVAIWRSYPHWKPTEPMDDKLLILEDADGDGKADRCTTFAGDLQHPTGFEFWNGGVLVSQGPDIVSLRDVDGDDRYDVKERVVHGLDTADTHHTANSFALDPGGAIYFQEGTFHHSQIETPWGPPRRVANGAVFRFEPRSRKIDVYVSYGFANPHGHVFDRWGQDFVYDGTGADPYHGLLFSGDIDFPDKHGRPPTLYQQRTRPCSGVEILSSSHFPEALRGNLLVNNVIGFQGILQYRFEDKEASFTATEVEPIVSSTDPNFRPTDVEVAPDGSVYFIDWQNPIIGHMQHNLRDPSRDREHGRVYRVRYAGRELLKPIAIAGQPISRLLDLLKDPDDRVRHRARIELSGRPTADVLAAAAKWIGELDPQDQDYEHHAMEGLWLYQSHNVVNIELLKRMLRSSDFRARAAATRVLTYWRDRVPEPLELLREQVADDHPRVRLHAIWALSYFTGADAEGAYEVLVESSIYPQDDYIKYVLNETTKTLERRIQVDASLPSAVGPLMKLFQGGRLPLERIDTVVEMICQRGNERDLQVIVDAVLGGDRFGVEVQKKTLSWLTDAANTRKVRPLGDRNWLEKWISGPTANQDRSLQQAAIRLASAWREETIVPALLNLARQEGVSVELQESALQGLALIGNQPSQEALRELAQRGATTTMRLQAAAGLVGFDLDAAASAAAAAIQQLGPQDDPGPALDAFLQRQQGPEKLGQSLSRVALTADTAKRLLRTMYAVGRNDASLADVLSEAAGLAADAPPPTPKEIARFVSDVMEKGDPARGEAIFRRKDLNCMKCHSVSRAGGQVGPDLSAVGGSSPIDYIVNSILNPNLAVKEQFATRVFVLSTGISLTGVVIDRDAVRVNLRDAHGNTIPIPVADIDEELPGQSLMPQGLTKFLTRDEIVDLTRFVAELGRPGAYAVQTAKTIQRWRVLREAPQELSSDVPHLEHLRQFAFDAPATAWESAYARVGGVLPLSELRPHDPQKILILQGELQVSTAGDVAVKATCDVGLQMWIDSTQVNMDAEGEAAGHEVSLTKGLHRVTLRVEGSPTDRQTPGLRVECSAPAGSPANFEVIGGP